MIGPARLTQRLIGPAWLLSCKKANAEASIACRGERESPSTKTNNPNMSSLRNAIPRRAHKERSQPWVSLSPYHVFACNFKIAYSFLFFHSLGRRGKNSAFSKSTRTISSVLKHSTRKKTLCGYPFTLSSSFNFSFLPLLTIFNFLFNRNLGKKQRIEMKMNFTSRWLEQKPLMEFINQSKWWLCYMPICTFRFSVICCCCFTLLCWIV